MDTKLSATLVLITLNVPTGITKKPLLVEAMGRANTRKESAKIRNRKMLKKVSLYIIQLSPLVLPYLL